MGNIIPALIALSFFALGAFDFVRHGTLTKTVWVCAFLFPASGWLAMQVFGFFDNQKMRSLLGKRLDAARPPVKEERYFVGAATPTYRSLLDPHEDIAFLIVHEDSLELFGESIKLSLDRQDISKIRMRANPHTLLLTGGWISIEGTFGGKEGRLLIEPREKVFLLQNWLFGFELRDRLNDWKITTTPTQNGSAS